MYSSHKIFFLLHLLSWISDSLCRVKTFFFLPRFRQEATRIMHPRAPSGTVIPTAQHAAEKRGRAHTRAKIHGRVLKWHANMLTWDAGLLRCHVFWQKKGAEFQSWRQHEDSFECSWNVACRFDAEERYWMNEVKKSLYASASFYSILLNSLISLWTLWLLIIIIKQFFIKV